MTGFDLGVIAITLISGLLAMIRGFVREMLSILAWIGAAAAAILALPYLGPLARQVIAPAWLADAVAGFTVFAIVLVLGTIVTFRLGERVPEGRVGLLDRTAGFIFGLARGFLLVTIAYIFIAWLVPRDALPGWMAGSRLLPAVAVTAQWLTGWAGDDAPASRRGEAPVPRAHPGSAPSVKPQSSQAGPVKDKDNNPSPAADTAAGEGYNAEERRRLDQLFESLGRDGDR